jgi:hypothetical protein
MWLAGVAADCADVLLDVFCGYRPIHAERYWYSWCLSKPYDPAALFDDMPEQTIFTAGGLW